MIEKGLPAKLWLLSKDIREKVEESKNSGEIFKTTRLYSKPKFKRFEYKEGGISYTSMNEYITKEVWQWKDQLIFIRNVTEQLANYSEIVSLISKKCRVDEAQADSWLSRFTGNLSNEILENAGDEVLVDHITTFIGDLENAPIRWDVTVWIKGVWVENERYEIGDELTIRRPERSDFEIETPVEMLPLPPIEPYDFREPPSAIIELTHTTREQQELSAEIGRILETLRLHKLGSVFPIRTTARPKSFLTFGSTSIPSVRFDPNYTYSISEEDVPQLKDLLTKIRTLLPKETLSKAPEEVSPPVIALRRYNDALLKPERIESRITSVMTCFEALYLKEKERMELSHRLSQRASAMLKLFNASPPVEIYRDLSRAYDIRSTYIHGSELKSDEHMKAPELAKKVLEYARISLLLFLQLKNIIDKESLISKIDNALLDENAYCKLKKVINENCRIW